ncbi:MAG: DNA-processing protein DprA [bacterium]
MKPSCDPAVALLRLFFTPGLGPVFQARVLQVLREPARVFDLPRLLKEDPSLFVGLPLEALAKVNGIDVGRRAEKEWEGLQKKGARLISVLDPEYPPLLRRAYKAPAILFLKGQVVDWERHVPLAFVGTRGASDYGRKTVEYFIEGLKGFPVAVISGFALGIDAFAHQAALKFGLPTWGVTGTGLDQIYPKENERLYGDMLQKGTIVTQFSLGTAPLAWNFPERNQTIAGISQAVLVIEAPQKSGALLTAQFAMEEGREVMAVPGNIFSAKNKGCHRLLQQGAKLVGGVEDILEELKLDQECMGSVSNLRKVVRTPLPALDLSEQTLFQSLTEEPVHIDKIAEISNLAPSLAAGALTTLVLKGLAEELPGKFFVRNA